MRIYFAGEEALDKGWLKLCKKRLISFYYISPKKRKEMKIYLADTIQREHLKHNEKMKPKHHLESFFSLIEKKGNFLNWWCVKAKNDTNNKK